MKKKTIVITGNHNEFLHYLEAIPHEFHLDFVSAESARDLFGIRADKIIETDTAFKRPDYHEIKELAESRLF